MLLLEHGADINTRESQNGSTPLMKASGEGHAGMVELLLQKGAHKHLKDTRGQTALDSARGGKFNQWEECVKLLSGAVPATKKLSAEEQLALTQNEALYDACCAKGDTTAAARTAITAGADVNWHNPENVSE